MRGYNVPTHLLSTHRPKQCAAVSKHVLALKAIKGNENSVAYIQTAVAEEPNLLHEDLSFAVKEGANRFWFCKRKVNTKFHRMRPCGFVVKASSVNHSASGAAMVGCPPIKQIRTKPY